MYTMTKEIRCFSELVVSKENISKILTNIAKKREEVDSIKYIPYIQKVRQETAKFNPTITMQLFQEEFLCAQHEIMNPNGDKKRGMKAMLASVVGMEEYSLLHGKEIDPFVNNRRFRFYGRLFDGLGQFALSQKCYEKCNKSLEISGFIANSLFRQGLEIQGRKLVDKTLNDFDTSPEGISLKERDYYTWAVWKSGIEIRTIHYFIDKYKTKSGILTGNKKRDRYLKNMWSDASKILSKPNYNFDIRQNELRSITSLMIK